MKNEADFKKAFKLSVKTQKGFSLSLAAPTFAGIPDLYVIMPEYIPVLIEAKWLGEIKRDTFFRKIPFTEMQIHWIDKCHNITPYSALGLIGFIYKGIPHAALVVHGTPLFYTFSSSFLTDCSHVKYSAESNDRRFDVEKLFSGVPIPKIGNAHKNGKPTVTYDYEGCASTLAVRR